MQLNTFTNASFNDIENVNASLHVSWPWPNEEEWDKSSLDFDPQGTTLKRGGSCNPPNIFAEIYNGGEDMTYSTWTWELFRVGKGNQSKVPQSPALDSGEVEKIQSGKIGKIESNASLDGNGDYRFKVTKPDRPGNPFIWSEVIEINDCSMKKSLNEQSTKEGEGTSPSTEGSEQIDNDKEKNENPEPTEPTTDSDENQGEPTEPTTDSDENKDEPTEPTTDSGENKDDPSESKDEVSDGEKDSN